MKIGVIITVFVVGFLALILYSTLHGPRFRAEVCMTYNGQRACKTVSAKSEQGAVRAGTEGSCADIASGVTDTMKCVAAEPVSVKWLSRP
jgi:hypothetical protein